MNVLASAVLDGLAVDAANGRLYYANAGHVGRIGEVSTDGRHHRILVTELESKPRSIVLDLSNRYITTSISSCLCQTFRTNCMNRRTSYITSRNQ